MTNRFIKLSGNYQKTEKDSYKYIKDTTTNLIWQRETLGPMTWYEAMELNKNGWRIPTLQELGSIRDLQIYSPCCAPIFKSKSTMYWSLSPVAYGSYDAWGVGFYYGFVDSNYKYNNGHVRLVRGKSKYLEELHK
jgi:hypothetical protein